MHIHAPLHILVFHSLVNSLCMMHPPLSLHLIPHLHTQFSTLALEVLMVLLRYLWLLVGIYAQFHPYLSHTRGVI